MASSRISCAAWRTTSDDKPPSPNWARNAITSRSALSSVLCFFSAIDRIFQGIDGVFSVSTFRPCRRGGCFRSLANETTDSFRHSEPVPAVVATNVNKARSKEKQIERKAPAALIQIV